MLDLETLSTRANAVILIIGAIKFKRNGNTSSFKDIDEKDKFYRRVTLKSCTDVKMDIDPETINWWHSQDKKVKHEALYSEDRCTLEKSLKDFSEWFNGSRFIWGNGSSFDVTIIEEAYKRVNIDIPWKFWNVRDLRTLFDFGRVYNRDLPTENKHDALYDCYRQIVGFHMAVRNLKSNKV